MLKLWMEHKRCKDWEREKEEGLRPKQTDRMGCESWRETESRSGHLRKTRPALKAHYLFHNPQVKLTVPLSNTSCSLQGAAKHWISLHPLHKHLILLNSSHDYKVHLQLSNGVCMIKNTSPIKHTHKDYQKWVLAILFFFQTSAFNQKGSFYIVI